MLHGLFPNTGHHFFFLPFSDDPNGKWPKAQVDPGVIKTCNGDLDAWAMGIDEDGIEMKWLLWRLGTQDGQPGIHVTFDTNVGDCSRGAIVKPMEPQRPHPYSPGKYDSEYFAEDLADDKLRAEMPDGMQILRDFPFTNETLMKRVPSFHKTAATAQPPSLQAVVEPSTLAAHASIFGPGSAPRAPVKIEPKTVVQCFEFWWPRFMADAANTWDVDLIVDFGNSRSVALLLERPPLAVGGNMPTLGNLLSPVRMLSRAQAYHPNRNEGAEARHAKDPLAVFDSWFVTRQPQFADLHPPKRHEDHCMAEPRIEAVSQKVGVFKKELVQMVTGVQRRSPHIFVEMAPVAMGKDANQLLEDHNPEKGGTLFQSSPKRYAWDNDPLAGMEWCMVPNHDWNSHDGQSPRLRAHVLAYMPQNHDHGQTPEHGDTEWEINNPPPGWPHHLAPEMSPEHPHYPRADSLTWVALGIIEQAYRQMCSEEFRRTNERFMKRRLRSVVVTYPPGWTGEELKVYRRKWNTAINIFALSHLADPVNERPLLDMGYDESISAQLPIVYSEIRRMGNDGDSWLRLMGREEPGRTPVSRVMTVDVGGGTTDYSVYEYNSTMPGASVALDCSLLFKDSSNIAGDQLVEALIQEMLLPKIAGLRSIKTDPALKTKFEKMFNPTPGRSKDAEQQWRKITRLVLVPIINHWLTSYSESEGVGSPDGTVGSAFESGNALELLNKEWTKAAGLGQPLLERADEIKFDYQEIEKRIHRIFRPLCNLLSKLVEAFDVDMVILSGKPSELPGLRALVTRMLPLLPCRIVSAKDYPIESWYPYQENGRIYDAKTVTATGVALSRAMSVNAKLTPNWAPLNIHPSENLLRENCWVRVPDPDEPPLLTHSIYLDNGTVKPRQEETLVPVAMLVGTRIGRTLLPTLSNIEPVYRLRWRRKEDEELYAGAAVKVRLKRVPPKSAEESESLELTELQGVRDPITKDMVELQLCTLQDSSFWMDRAAFKVRW